jgi:hypothetical protein
MRLAAVAFLASACSSSTAPRQIDLEGNRHRWAEHMVHDYQYTYRTICFCALIDSARVLVVADTVQEVVELPSGVRLNPKSYPTVEGLFQIIDNAIASKYDVHVTYAPDLGYPTEIDIPAKPGVLDDGVTYLIHDFLIAALTDRAAGTRR